MNWGTRLAWAGIILSLGAAIGYAIVKDYRRALYYFFAACITATVAWQCKVLSRWEGK